MSTSRLQVRSIGMTVLLAAFVVMTIAPGALADGPAKAPEAGPVSQGFVESMIPATGGFGKRPNPVPFTLDATATARAARQVLPSSYSLIDLGRLTPVKNQGSYGTCWTFANLAAVESGLRPGQTWDFSEDNLVTRSGFGPFGDEDHPVSKYEWGGWDLMAIAYLTRWAGPVNESEDRYHTPVPPKVNRVRKHVQGAVSIPGRAYATDNDLIKQLVMANGALSVGMFWDDSAYNDEYTNYPGYYLPAAQGENHGVCIVGWDDTFAAVNFYGSSYGTPPGNGAFLVRNSWGKNWGDNGYFWVSYFDQSFARDQGLDYGGCTSYSKVDSTTNYRRQYSYDKLGATGHLGYDSLQVWGANRFTARASQRITAAGFYALQSGTTYELWAGRNWSTLTLRAAGTSVLPGYDTVKFGSPLPVTSGGKFIVAVRLVSPTERWPLACEYQTDTWQAGATASPGQSYVRNRDADAWEDLGGSSFDANVCLKAFAN